MLNKAFPASVMLDAVDLHRQWATGEDYTLYYGPGTEREAAILKARYPRHLGAIEMGLHMKPGMMAIAKEQTASGGVLDPRILLG